MIRVAGDVICQVLEDGRWLVYNVFTRSGLGTEFETMDFLSALHGETESELLARFASSRFKLYDVTMFSHGDGLLADPSQPADITVLLSLIRRLLKPDGRFISVESSYSFWLAPWLGDADHPFTVMSEYQDRSFSVTPILADFLGAFCGAGICLTDMREAAPDTDYSADPRAAAFACEFPLWQLFEFAVYPSLVENG